MSNKAKRSEGLLNKIGDKLGMTDAGKAFIIGALDPFHDNPVNLQGYPDGNTSPSIVQIIKQSTTITAPPNLPATGSWDCHIVQWPWLDANTLAPCYPDTSSFTPPQGLGSSPQYAVAVGATPVAACAGGGVWILAVPSGTPTSPISYINSEGNKSLQQLVIPNVYNIGKRRCVGAAFEVYNTSAQLYRGGSVCCYRSPIENSEKGSVISVGLTSGTTITSQQFVKPSVFEGPPATPAAALLLPNSRQWDAENGCYVVGAFSSEEIPAMTNFNTYPIITDHTTPTGIAQCVDPTWNSYSIGTVPGPFWSTRGTFETGMDLSGAYFTGLSSQSTLTLNWNVAIERMPGNEDLDLVVLAKPACERDDVAIRFYSHCVTAIPVGVPVRENGFGDWFKDVVSTASDFIAPVLSAIPHPAAQGIGMAIKGTNAVLNPDRVPRALVPSNARPYADGGYAPTPVSTKTPRQLAAGSAVKNKNAMVREKNALIRAKNEEIRARKALKATKKK